MKLAIERRAVTPTVEEQERFASLSSAAIVDTFPEEEFDFLVAMAADACAAPIAALSVLTADRQWSRSTLGLPFSGSAKEEALSRQVVAEAAPIVVRDVSLDERFADSALVMSEPRISFYAGAPVTTSDGYTLGALCVADTQPRDMDEPELRTLTGLARQAAGLIDRRVAELRLESAQRRIDHGERLARLGTWEWDIERGISIWSPELRRIFGLGEAYPDTLEAFLEFVHEDDRADYERATRRVMERGGPFRQQVRIRRASDNAVRTVEINGEVIANDGRPRVALGATQDISDSLRAQAGVRERGQILDQVEAGVVAFDLDWRITQWNRGAERLYGWSALEAVGRPAAELKFVTEVPIWASTAKAVVTEGITWEGEIEVERKDGKTIPMHTTVSPIRDPAGEVEGIATVSVDISEQKRNEAELARSRRETIHRLSRALESRDIETGHHIERIGEFAGAIGERLGLPPGEVEMLRVASPMHDVGKIAIPDNILHKPGKLTSEERSEMQRHVEIGHRILAGSGIEVLELAAKIALTHHEWFDGSGYPRGLSGDEIPLAGRIVAVADVFDALTIDRIYRPAYAAEDAVAIMIQESGTHFDPDVLDVLIEDFEDFIEIRTGIAPVSLT